MLLPLIPHPSSPPGPVKDIDVQCELRGGKLWLRFYVEVNPDLLAWPPEAEGRADGLWKTTCFEAFVQTPAGYVEFNISPSGQWASYAFDGYRAGVLPATERVTNIGLEGGDDYAALEAEVEAPHGGSRVGLSVVIETVDGAISYWALAHPSDKPDFHHPDSFVLELP
jgi:hypothetical protein